MSTIQVKDKFFKPFISAEKIQAAIERVADQMNKDLQGKNPMFICVLNGAFMFASDLYKNIRIDSEITFMRMKSYEGMETSGHVKCISGLLEDVTNRTVVVIEDIVDTGYTMQSIIAQLKDKGAAEVLIATLLHKPEALKVPELKLDYVALEIPNAFIVGYGLDYDEMGRNLKDIYVIAE
ncbi:MAG: hypoxanthine phosphoribosyltransferase [Bacteroidales bacterium]